MEWQVVDEALGPNEIDPDRLRLGTRNRWFRTDVSEAKSAFDNLVSRQRSRYTVSDEGTGWADHGAVCESSWEHPCNHVHWFKGSMRLNDVYVKYVWLPGQHRWKRVY